jgi:predicted RNase H-like nuclease (RuvC/YqgF family)
MRKDKVPLYTSIDDGLNSLIEQRAEKEHRSKASVIEDLLQKGLEAERIQKEAENVKEAFTDHDTLKTEISELKQNSNELSKALREIQNITIEKLNGYNDGIEKLRQHQEMLHKALCKIASEMGFELKVCEASLEPYLQKKEENNPKKKRWSVSDV